MVEKPYNPLDKINLGKSVAEALLDKAADALHGLSPFAGAGIYAIYYRGNFLPYARMAARNSEAFEWPIYVGKAIPSGGRKGGAVLSEVSGQFVWSRLREHAESIESAENLDVSDFGCRHLIVDDVWIPLAESLLITRFKPLWNLALEGFGNHDPGAGRYNGLRPLWDVLHNGRSWANKCRPREDDPMELGRRVENFLEVNEPTDTRIRF